MNCDVTINAEDFKTIHNTLWELEYRGLDGVAGAERIRAALKDAYAQENTSFETKSDHYEQIREGRNFRSIWSVYEVSDLTAAHPYVGATHVVYDCHWGSQPVWVPIEGSRWVDLYAAADRCIQRSGDDHHTFIEAFEPVADQPQTLRLTTGS